MIYFYFICNIIMIVQFLTYSSWTEIFVTWSSFGRFKNLESEVAKKLFLWLHRCWWRMLETKYVGDNYKMLVTVLAILVTNIHYLFTLASGTNIQKMSSTSKFNRQHPQIITNLSQLKSPTSLSPFLLLHTWGWDTIKITMKNFGPSQTYQSQG